MMDKEKFNSYCAEVMGYEAMKRMNARNPFDFSVWCIDATTSQYIPADKYNPYEDLNQRVSVVTELLKQRKWDISPLINCLQKAPWDIEKGMRDFIISTMEEK